MAEIETDEPAESQANRLVIEGQEHIAACTDPHGRVICQTNFQIRITDADGGDRVAPLEMSQQGPASKRPSKRVFAPYLHDLAARRRMTPEAIEPIFSGASWAGTVLWRAAVKLVEAAILAHSRAQPPLVPFGAETTVIELGCGLGVPGMVCARLGAGRVVLTEQESLVSLLERNVESNFAAGGARVDVREFSWSAQGAKALRDEITAGAPFDLIICCDCVYIPLYGESWVALVEAIDGLAGAESHVLLSLERRHVKNGDDGVEPFLSSMAAAGFDKAYLPSTHPIELIHFTRRQ